ncbi:phosphoribosyltransferase-like protein [Zychaea mexicana]|uniref:phosphoribosyltransferase-like protein n=1 Tax=Zychaea mexicana TaxID=64656 RepID=UPI0022FE7722|nr:phosphoribosyltransferase-like protein [Zychaea mexicana]KAI9496872.1 phosphoribosyltransferase-like protein [Zychaea mexicana]
MRGLVVFAGSSNQALTQRICDRLSCEPGKSFLAKFSNNETRVELYESVREQDVYIVQSGCGHVNDNFMELLIMIQACKTASAKKVTAVIPLFPYSRQPDAPFGSGAPLTRAPPMTVPSTPRTIPSTPKSQPTTPRNGEFFGSGSGVTRLTEEFDGLELSQEVFRLGGPMTTAIAGTSTGNLLQNTQSGYRQWVARSGTLVAELLTCAGADHIITLDLHDPQYQGFFDCTVDNLSAIPIMIKYIQHHIYDYKNIVIVSPDAGGAKRATSIAEKLHMDFALIHKERRRPDKPQKHDLMLVGDVRGRRVCLIDDVVDTGFTITKAAKLLHENGAQEIYCIATHAIMSGDALDRIEKSYLDKVIVSDSVPQGEHTRVCSKITTFPVAPLFSEAIRRIHNGESVSMLFDPSHELF